jgi:uncharacterized protein YndB with AHSA1/START domain
MTDLSADGALTIEDGVATLTFVRRLHHPVERVWAAITDPAERAHWVGHTLIDASQGGTIETDPKEPPLPRDAKQMRGRILVWDPPRVLEHEWHQAIVEDGVVRYELAPDGDDTVLTFTHRGLGVRNATGFLPGTHAYLDRLAALLDGDELPDWGRRYAEVQPAYASPA